MVRPASARPGGRHTRADVVAALLVGSAAAALVLFHLFVPYVIGTSDTGDQRRLLCQIDAGDPHFGDGRNSAERFVAIRLSAIPPNPVHCGAFRVTERYPSSALAVLFPAQQLTHLAGLRGALDMRMVGLLYAVLFGLVIGAFVLVLPGPRLARIAVAAALGGLGADATFVPYFNSAFSEPMEYVALLGTFAALLALWRQRTVSPWRLALATAVFMVVITAKSQDIPLCVLLAGALLTVPCPVGRLRGRVTGRVLPAVAAAVLMAVGATDLYLQPRQYNEQLVYTDVFFTILADSHDVRSDLAEFGLPPDLARYAGITWFAVEDELARDPHYAIFLKKITMADVALFYAHHPDRLGPVTRVAVQDVLKARHPLPNTTRFETAEPQVVCRICLIPPVGAALAPAAVVIWPLWELGVLAVGALLVRRRRTEPPWRALGLVLITSVVFALFHTATAILGDGYAELGKHVFPAVVDTWMVIPLVVLALVGLLAGPPSAYVPVRPGHARLPGHGVRT
ncbi:MAG TPA: hypothetical protein VI248_01470 [Kineosporiaceae bacterium]